MVLWHKLYDYHLVKFTVGKQCINLAGIGIQYLHKQELLAMRVVMRLAKQLAMQLAMRLVTQLAVRLAMRLAVQMAMRLAIQLAVQLAIRLAVRLVVWLAMFEVSYIDHSLNLCNTEISKSLAFGMVGSPHKHYYLSLNCSSHKPRSYKSHSFSPSCILFLKRLALCKLGSLRRIHSYREFTCPRSKLRACMTKILGLKRTMFFPNLKHDILGTLYIDHFI